MALSRYIRGKRPSRYTLYNTSPETSDDDDRSSPRICEVEIHPDLEIARSVTECLGKAWDRESYADLTVYVGSQSFQCHKFILSACSDFFAALLRSDEREDTTDFITLEGMTANTFRLILDAIYRGKSVITVINMLDVWQGAHHLQIEFLIKVSENFIVKQISIQNYFDVYQVADFLESDEVKDALHTLITNNFSSVINSKTFPNLPLGGLLAVVSSKDFRVSPDVAVRAILTWVRAQPFGHGGRAKKKNHVGQLPGGCQQPDILKPGATAKARDNFRHGTLKSKEIPQRHLPPQDCLAQLLGAVHLNGISNEYLSELMRDQTVLASEKALRMVSNIGAERLRECNRYRDDDDVLSLDFSTIGITKDW